MQITRLHIICLCAAIQIHLIVGHPWQYPEDSQHGQPMVGSPANNGRGSQKAVTPAPYDSNGQPNTQQGARKDSVIEQQAIISEQTNGEPGTRVDPAHNEGHNDGIEGQENVDSVTHEPQGPDSQPNPGSSSPHNNNGNDNSNTVGTNPHESNRQGKGRFNQPPGQQPKRHICTISTANYGCQIQNVHLKKNVKNVVFGLEHNPHQNLTFRDSTLEYLPKSLIDAFPRVTLLNLNDLKISSIEPHAFEHAADLQFLYMANNRLVQIDRGAFRGAKKLETLVLSNNEITYLDYNSFDHNTELRSVVLNHNRLTTLPAFTKTVHLEYLTVSHNNLASIGDEHFRQLNMLKTLDLSFNRLKRLDLQQLHASLDKVDVSFNNLSEIVLPIDVKWLNAENNSLTTFTVSQQCKLEQLNLAKNRLDTLPELRACRSLSFFDLSNNLLEAFTLPTTMLKLEYLRLSYNNLFEISLPLKSAPFSLKALDLSHNRLSYGPSLTAFKMLETVRLNDNNLISLKSYADDSHKKFQSYYMENNEWSCGDIEKFQHLTADKGKDLCAKDLENVNGICCKVYTKPFNDRLNEILRAADFHERAIQEKCPKTESTPSNPMEVLDNIRNAIASSDKIKGNKLKQIQATTQKKNALGAELENLKAARNSVENINRDIARAIEKHRQTYRVAKEGLISDKTMLDRIITFVQEKDAFTEDLLSRRRLDTEDAKRVFEAKQQEIKDVNDIITTLQKQLAELKLEATAKKKEKDLLEKKVNKNAPAIRGSTGQRM